MMNESNIFNVNDKSSFKKNLAVLEALVHQ